MTASPSLSCTVLVFGQRVICGPVASPDAQVLHVARVLGCWLVCTVAAIRVSVSPRFDGAHRTPESVSSSTVIYQVGLQPRKLDHLSQVQGEARVLVQDPCG